LLPKIYNDKQQPDDQLTKEDQKQKLSIEELQKSHLTAFFIVTTSDTNGHQRQEYCCLALATKKKSVPFYFCNSSVMNE
jgi:hypothetical protein